MPFDRNSLTQELLKQRFHYDPETGHFTHLVAASPRVKVGDRAGSGRPGNYVVITLFNERFLAHRLAWLYVHGHWPMQEIDHIDQCKSNNAIANLRDVSRTVNECNKLGLYPNKTGYQGVSMNRGKFMAQITLGGKSKTIGRYATADQAHRAYVEAKARLHPGLNSAYDCASRSADA